MFDKLSWNVLLPQDSNNISFNIFNSMRFRAYLMDLKARYKKDKSLDIKAQLRSGLMYCFWCKYEYEIVINRLPDSGNLTVDVYTQVEQNLDIFYDYIIKNWRQIPAKTYRQQRNIDKDIK